MIAGYAAEAEEGELQQERWVIWKPQVVAVGEGSCSDERSHNFVIQSNGWDPTNKTTIH